LKGDKMKRFGMLLAGVGLMAGSGVLAAARADDNRENMTLFTAAIHGTGFHCNAVNVSGKPLLIAISIIDGDGNVLSPVPVPNPKTPPDVNASNDLEPAPMTEAYCKVQVAGTDDPNDVRVAMKVNLIRTFDQGGRTNIPVFLSWILEGR
jgi:hypothetical protein